MVLFGWRCYEKSLFFCILKLICIVYIFNANLFYNLIYSDIRLMRFVTFNINNVLIKYCLYYYNWSETIRLVDDVDLATIGSLISYIKPMFRYWFTSTLSGNIGQFFFWIILLNFLKNSCSKTFFFQFTWFLY